MRALPLELRAVLDVPGQCAGAGPGGFLDVTIVETSLIVKIHTMHMKMASRLKHFQGHRHSNVASWASTFKRTYNFVHLQIHKKL